jgi:hypothetical protein
MRGEALSGMRREKEERDRIEIPRQAPPPPPQGDEQIGAEGEIYDPPFFRKGYTRPDGTSGFGPMASNDFGGDLDIPTVIRNLSD